MIFCNHTSEHYYLCQFTEVNENLTCRFNEKWKMKTEHDVLNQFPFKTFSSFTWPVNLRGTDVIKSIEIYSTASEPILLPIKHWQWKHHSEKDGDLAGDKMNVIINIMWCKKDVVENWLNSHRHLFQWFDMKKKRKQKLLARETLQRSLHL